MKIEVNEAREFERVSSLMEDPAAVFVFGSNLRGAHGGGAARTARLHYGAVEGKGVGFWGRSYAIPTMDEALRTLALEEIDGYVHRFLRAAKALPERTFVVTRIGCGIAGYRDEQIAPLFDLAPENVKLPEGWREYNLDG